MIKHFALVVSSVLLSLAVSLNVFAQNASVTGTVSDAGGALIPGAEVAATNVNTGIVNTRISNESGAYSFPSLQPGVYKLTAALPGFQTATFNDVQLSQNLSVRFNFRLEVGQIATNVEVTVAADTTLATTSVSVGNVLPTASVSNLPLATRNVQDLIATVPGVRAGIADNISGMRSNFVNTTRDGLIQGDTRYLSITGVELATYTSPDLVDEVQVVTGSIDAESGRGPAQVRLQTRSGTNAFHGALFASNNNSAFNAQNWFQKLAASDPQYTNRNQYGGRLGGPIIKNKAFFFVLFEGQRQVLKQPFVGSVLTPAARDGIFRYFPGRLNGNALSSTPSVDLKGNIAPGLNAADMRTFNIFSDVNDPNRKAIDPNGWIKATLGRMPLPNDYTIGDGLNNAGYRWNRRLEGTTDFELITGQNTDRNSLNTRFDYQLDTANKLTFTLSREKDWADTNQGGLPDWPGGPRGKEYFLPNTFTAAWVATISKTALNEFRMGRKITEIQQRDPVMRDCCNGTATDDISDYSKEAYKLLPSANNYAFNTVPATFGKYVTTGGSRGATNPTLQFSDSLSWIRNTHAFKFGFDYVANWSNAWNVSSGPFPIATFGNGNTPVQGINSTRFPGLQSADATRAESLLNDLTGSIATVTQGFVTNSPTQTDWYDFKKDPRRYTNFRQNDYSGYFKDTWTATKNLTLNIGLRYDFYGVPYEHNGLAPHPKGGQAGIFGISGTNFGALWNPGASGGNLTTLEFVGKNSPNPGLLLWPNDSNNFAPSFGFSWHVPEFKRQTVVRGGYGVNYVGTMTGFNMDTCCAGVPGRAATVTFAPSSYFNLASVSLPLTPATKPFALTPLTDRTQTFTVFADNRRVPYIQNWNLSVQREVIPNLTLEVAYIGNKSTKLYNVQELNEPNVLASWKGSETFLDAFNITRAGGQSKLFDAMLNGITLGTGVPAVNGATQTGSSALRSFGSTNTFIANGEVAALAQFLNRSTAGTGVPGGLIRTNGFPENFLYVNPQFNSAQIWGNLSNASYHSMQVQVTRRLSNGFSGQFSYLLSKAMGNSPMGASESTATTIDPRNLHRNYGTLSFDRSQTFYFNGAWELPFGRNKMFLKNAPNWITRGVEGWQLSGISSWTSGAPLEITSPDRVVGVTNNRSHPDLLGVLPSDIGTVHVGNGFVEYLQALSTRPGSTDVFGTDPSRLATRFTNRVVVDSSGKTLLVNPAPGQAGNLGINPIIGPAQLQFDVSLMKRTQIREGMTFTIRADAISFLNKPQWGNPVTDINSNSFGRITTSTGERKVTLGARIDF